MESHSEELIASLQHKARGLRYWVVKMIAHANSGHPGGSLSAVEIVTALYFHQMRCDPHNPRWPGRDRFILSKGHAAPLLYAVLAEKGYFPKEALMTLRRLGSILQGHPDMTRTPGVEITAGPLGLGLSVGNGMALGARLLGLDIRVYVLLGDGEINEGQVWEAAMTASHRQINTLTAIVDLNGLQLDGPTAQVKNLEPVADKWRAFGWNTIEIDGHDFRQVLDSLDEAANYTGGPTVILARTVKGKGVSFMENRVEWHSSLLTEENVKAALAELG